MTTYPILRMPQSKLHQAGSAEIHNFAWGRIKALLNTFLVNPLKILLHEEYDGGQSML